MHLFPIVALCTLPIFVHAWLPGEHKQIFSRDGIDLFNRSNLHEAGLLQKRFLPSSYGNDKNKIRGVNLVSLFVLENWLANDVFSGLGCNAKSEFDCVSSLHDQAKANAGFRRHWDTWVTAADFKQMVSYGLNTVRIPIGECSNFSFLASREPSVPPDQGRDIFDSIMLVEGSKMWTLQPYHSSFCST